MDELKEFIKNNTGTYPENDDTDIFLDMGVTGDDFHELIENFALKYNVDMSNYLWYFHSNDEEKGIGELFYTPIYKRVKRIPVTPKMLNKFMQINKWDLNYPKHSIPKRRYDILINQIVVIAFVFGIIIWLLMEFI